MSIAPPLPKWGTSKSTTRSMHGLNSTKQFSIQKEADNHLTKEQSMESLSSMYVKRCLIKIDWINLKFIIALKNIKACLRRYVVELKLNPTLRQLHSRLHTAGHLVAEATMLHYPYLQANQGNHYPNNSYVRFKILDGTINNDPEKIKEQIVAQIESWINEDLPVSDLLHPGRFAERSKSRTNGHLAEAHMYNACKKWGPSQSPISPSIEKRAR